MIEIVKTEIAISNDLLSRIKWCSNYCNVKPKIYNGYLRIIKHTNLAYIEPHRVIINDTLYLFFNEQEYFYISDLRTKYPLSKLQQFENVIDKAKKSRKTATLSNFDDFANVGKIVKEF